MSEKIFLLTIGLPLLTILLVFGMKYVAAIAQAKARLAGDEAFRQIAAQAAGAQAETASALAAMAVAMGELKTRLASVEKMLKEVE